MGISAKTRRLAEKYGMVKSSRSGHGGSRGNGSHLEGKKEGSQESRREEARTKKAIQRDKQKVMPT
jgi:hypothetical protein